MGLASGIIKPGVQWGRGSPRRRWCRYWGRHEQQLFRQGEGRHLQRAGKHHVIEAVESEEVAEAQRRLSGT
jgi:hypothetical protein